MANLNSIVLSTHRTIFTHLDEPFAFEEEGAKKEPVPKYSATWLIPKNHPDINAIMTCIYAAHAAEALTKFKGMPIDMLGVKDGIDCPLRDGDAHADKMIMRGKPAEQYDIMRGHWFLKATSSAEYPPVIFQQLQGQPRKEVLNVKQEIYSGCYSRCDIKCMGWNNAGNYGFSFYINSVCKTADGPRVGGFSASPTAYDVADVTDASTLLKGETVMSVPGAYVAPQVSPLVIVPGFTMPQAPAFNAPVPPIAQRPQLPSMTPPQVPGLPPVIAAPAPPVVQPLYNTGEGGAPIVSFDNGASWEWVK